MSEYQPRWLVFMHLFGPPATTLDFMGWVQDQWRHWERLNGRNRDNPKTEADHESFDQMLKGLIGQ